MTFPECPNSPCWTLTSMASLMMLKVFIYDKSLFHTLRVALLSRLNLDWSTSPPLPLLSRLKPLQEWPNSLSHQCIWTIAARLIFIMTLKGWMVALYCLQNKSEPLPGSSPRANFPCFCCSVPLHEFFLLPNWHTHFPQILLDFTHSASLATHPIFCFSDPFQ